MLAVAKARTSRGEVGRGARPSRSCDDPRYPVKYPTFLPIPGSRTRIDAHVKGSTAPENGDGQSCRRGRVLNVTGGLTIADAHSARTRRCGRSLRLHALRRDLGIRLSARALMRLFLLRVRGEG